jgi:hypothetical protein
MGPWRVELAPVARGRPVAAQALVSAHELVGTEGRHEREVAGQHDCGEDLGECIRSSTSAAA